MNIMIDLETLDTKPSAVLLSIGLVAFDKTGIKDKMYLVLSIEDQLKAGRTISESTLLWWMKQNEAARKEAFSDNRVLFSGGMHLVHQFCQKYPKAKIWGYGANFDPVLVDDAFRMVDLKSPWQYWDVRCLRTWCDDNRAPLPKNTGVLHNAIDDAERQSQHMIDTWNKPTGGGMA